MKIEVSQKTTTKAGTVANCLSRFVSSIFSLGVTGVGIVMMLLAGMRIQEDIADGVRDGYVFVPMMIVLGYAVMKAAESLDS